MKLPIYVRVAKTGTRKGYKVDASSTPNHSPLHSGSYNTEYYPTVAFALSIDLPDSLFEQAEKVIAEINVNEKDAKIAAEIAVPEGKK